MVTEQDQDQVVDSPRNSSGVLETDIAIIVFRVEHIGIRIRRARRCQEV